MKKNYKINKHISLLFLFLFSMHFSALAQSKSSRRSDTSASRASTTISTIPNVSRNGITQLGGPPSPLTVTACNSYTWAQNGQTYNSSGTYFSGSPVTQFYSDLTTWNTAVGASGASSYVNSLSGIVIPPDPIVINMGGVTVTFSAPSGMYSSGAFIGTNVANEAMTITFSQAIYGVGGNFYTTDVSDNVISGNVTASYSDSSVDSRTVTADTEFFGRLTTTPLTSLVLSTTTTTPNRYISIKNFKIAVIPTLFLTIDTPVTPTFNPVASICSGDSLAALPTTSNESITGTWSPALDNTTTTTYTFTPDAPQCATTTTLTITVNSTPPPTINGDINVTMTGGCSFLNGIYTDDGFLNGKKTYVYSLGSNFHISFDGVKWVLHTSGNLGDTGFENTTVPAGVYPPTTGWTATQCGGGTLDISFQTNSTFCDGATVADLSATGTNLQWYDVATGGTVLTNSTLLVMGSYFVSQTINGCESSRTELPVTINPTVTPTFTTVAPICGGAPLAALPTTSNNGITGTWSPAIDNTMTTTYTFTADPGQCVTATVVTLTIDVTPAPVTTAYSVCQGGTVTGGLTSTLSAGLPVPNFSGDNTGGPTYNRGVAMIQGGTCTNSGTGTAVKYVAHSFVAPVTGTYTFSTCGNATWDTFLSLYQDPFNPAGLCAGNTLVASADDNCAAQSTVTANLIGGTNYTLVVSGFANTDVGAYTVISTNPTLTPNVEWYTNPTGGTAIATGSPFNPVGVAGSGITDTNTLGATTFYAQFPGGTCRTPAVFTVSPIVTPSFAAVNPICFGTPFTLPTTSLEGITGTWSPAFNNTATDTYTFTPDAGQCVTGTVVTMTVTVNPIPVGDTLATAIDVTSTNYTTTGNNLSSNCFSDTIGEASPDVWYKVTLDQCATGLSVNTCTGSDYDTYIRVYAQDGTTLIDENDDFCGLQSSLSNLDVTSQDFVYVVVEGFDTEEGNYGLTISQTLAAPTIPTFTQVAPACNGDTLTALTTTSLEGITGSWLPALNNTATTTYTFTPDAGQCASTATMTIVINPKPALTFGANPFPVCEGTSTVLTVNVTNVTPTISYLNLSSVPQLANMNAATFGVPVTSPFPGVLLNTGSNGCAAFAAGSLTGKIALIQRGACAFAIKAQNAQDAGAVAVILYNNVAGNILPGGTAPGVTIPVYGITQADGLALIAAMTANEVNVTLSPPAPLNYSWSNGSNTNTTNTGILNVDTDFTVTVTNTSTGCANTVTITVPVTPNTIPTFDPVADICSGDTLAALPTTSTNGIAGAWSPALDNTTTTTYTFTPTPVAGQCLGTATLTITVNSASDPTGDSLQTFPVADPNDATIANIVISPTNVIWYGSLADAQNAVNPLPGTTVLTTGATYYAVNVVGACSSTPFGVTVTVTLGNDEFDDLNFTYYPNPTSSILNISYSKNITQVTVVNLIGQIIMTNKTNATSVRVDLSPLAEAAYFIRVVSDDKEKIIKVIKSN